MASVKLYRWTATVTGSGYFPLDMLRYDECWPKYEAQITRISQYPSREQPGERSLEISAWGQSAKVSPFTFDRWRSFGWLLSGERYVG